MEMMKPKRDVKVYRLGEERVLPLGPLNFHIKHLYLIIEGKHDWGPSIDVHAEVDGKDTEVVSFDCLANGPHYHAPGSARPTPLDPKGVGDGFDWSMGMIRDHMPEMLSMAGYMSLAKTIDREMFASRWREVRQAILESAPPAYAVPANAHA
ncbi:MAG: hypothetical protein FJ039_08710 [Chloroflexi bacterium]|nr:hypothetical protein [Chloroflexota bacterium]